MLFTIEGIVEGGQITLNDSVYLPEKTKVCMVVPDIQVDRETRIITPRLAHLEQAEDFNLVITSGAAPQTDESEITSDQKCKGCWNIGIMEEWN